MARPSHKPTQISRRKVSIAAGGGMRHEDIAIGLGITKKTLAKWYAAELSVGANARRMEVMQALYQSAKKGSSSAAKAYMAIDAQLAAPPIPKDKPLGKKEQAQVDAGTAPAGTEWGEILPDNVTPITRRT